MTLQRTAIRQYLVTQLTGNTSAETRVFDTRLTAFFEKELPLINILTLDEEVDDTNEGYSHNRELLKGPLHIVAVTGVSSTDSPGVVIDNLCEAIRAKVDRHLGGNATRCEYKSTSIQVNAEGQVPHLMATLMYDLEY